MHIFLIELLFFKVYERQSVVFYYYVTSRYKHGLSDRFLVWSFSNVFVISATIWQIIGH